MMETMNPAALWGSADRVRNTIRLSASNDPDFTSNTQELQQFRAHWLARRSGVSLPLAAVHAKLNMGALR